MNAKILVALTIAIILTAAGPVAPQLFGPVPIGAPGFGPAGIVPPPVALAPVLPHQRFYSGQYGYVTGGPGAGGIPGLANVQAAQNFESYNYGVEENGPHYQKYHHQTGAFHPVGVVAPVVPVVPAVPAVPAVPVVAA